jgi:hypothetical protein
MGVLTRVAAVLAVLSLATMTETSWAEEVNYVVANTRPPDAFLALRTHPSSKSGRRIMAMPNGTVLQVLQRNNDGWWYVRVAGSSIEGWALSHQGRNVWIICCTGSAAVPPPIPNDYAAVIGFKTPSNNIYCQLLDTEDDDGRLSVYLRCDLVDKRNPSPPPPRDCFADWGQAYAIMRDEPVARMICQFDVISDDRLQTLPYGSAWRQSGFNCISERDGLTCENRFGRGFRLSRFSQQLF